MGCAFQRSQQESCVTGATEREVDEVEARIHSLKTADESSLADSQRLLEELGKEFETAKQVILPTASGVSNEGGRSELLVPLPAVSWPWVPAWGLLEPPRRDGENAQKTGKNGGKMGEIRPKRCKGVGITWC